MGEYWNEGMRRHQSEHIGTHTNSCKVLPLAMTFLTTSCFYQSGHGNSWCIPQALVAPPLCPLDVSHWKETVSDPVPDVCTHVPTGSTLPGFFPARGAHVCPTHVLALSQCCTLSLCLALSPPLGPFGPGPLAAPGSHGWCTLRRSHSLGVKGHPCTQLPIWIYES